MSMHGHISRDEYDQEDEEAWIEAELEREMKALESSDLDKDLDDEKLPELDNNININDDEVHDELSSDMQDYVKHMRWQTERLEKDLEECDQLLQETDTIVSTPRPDQQELLELARERGEDVFTMKRKVLEDLEREDQEDERLKLESVNEDELEVNVHLKEESEVLASNTLEEGLGEGGGPVEDEGSPAFLTTLEEHRQTEEEEYQELKRRILGEPSYDMEVEREVEDGEEEVGEEEEEEESEQQGTLRPEEGMLMGAIDPAALEQKILREVLQWEDKWLEKNHRREEDVRHRTEEETMRMEEDAAIREEKIRGVKQEQENIHKQQEEEQDKIQKESEEVQHQIEKSLNQYQVEYEQIAGSIRQESETLEHAKEANIKTEEENRQKSATKIQALYRGYRVYKEEGKKVREHLVAWKEEKVRLRIAALDESRKKKADEKKRIEDEERRREEYKIKKEEDKKRLEEERKRKAEEDKKKEEEEKIRKALEEEQRKKDLEQKKEEEKRLEEERKTNAEKKKIEEEKRKKEEEEKRLEEKRQKEEKKRRMVEEQMKAAEEKRLKEEKEKVEAEKQKQEEKRKKEEKRKQEEERKRKEEEEVVKLKQMKKTEEEKVKPFGTEKIHSPVPPEGKPKTPRKKVNELRKSSMSPLANGSRSPSLDSENDVSQSQSGPVRDPDVRQSVRASHTVRASQSVEVRASVGDRGITPRSARSDMGKLLPERIEKQRLEWMQKCQPWSKTAQDLKSKKLNTNRKPLRRPISAKNLSALSESTVVQAARVTSLQQVTTVELHDLPGCSLKVLGQCPRLRALRINNSSIVSTDGVESCKDLTYLDLKHNALEAVTLRDHPKLMYINLSHNSLTSLQGLEGCAALRHLDASHNRITRISGLEGLSCLHTLDLSHNQLITARGLSAAPTVQHLDLTQNHLPSLDDLDPLGLLQVLKVSGNNILQPPMLKNNVLLRTLLLDDNSLCSVRNLSLSWLPLLHHLNLAQNSLSSLDDVGNCVILQDLDVSNNQILDVESLAKGLYQCCHLQKLRTEGNPVTEEADFRSMLLKALPWLEKLDKSKISTTRSTDALTEYESMCLEQIVACEKIREDFKRKISKTHDLAQLTSVHLQYYKHSHQVAVDHRYKHEYGDTVSDSVNTKPDYHPGPDLDLDLDLELKPDANSHATNHHQESDVSEMKDKFEMALLNMNGSNSAFPPVAKKESNRSDISDITQNKKIKAAASVDSRKLPTVGLSGTPVEHVAARRIQALWRGYSIRRDIEQHSRWWLAATTIQAAWRGHFVRKILEEMGHGLGSRRAWRHEAATKIQALWRGYRLRKRIEYALNYAKTSFDDTDDLDDEMNFKEVDLSAFDFNEDDLERGWTPPETPQIPANHATLRNLPPSSGQQAMSAKAAFDAVVDRPPHPPNKPRQAWRNFESPVSDVPYGSARRPPLPPVSRMSEYSGTGSEHTGATTQRTHRSRKEEQISEEWGFKDTRTAEMMMKRAKKLQYNSKRKKKLSQLDPKQRLALFRKLEESSSYKPVMPPPKKVLPRKEYFQAREEAGREKLVEKQRDKADTNQRCFEWVHTQVGSYEVGTSRINQRLNDATVYNNENLPQMDPNVIAGARPTLTGSPMSMELQSLESVSTAGDLQRRHSSSGDPASRLPPIKVSSAPAAQSRVDRPERMSFRNTKPKTLDSVGWGGGKKRR